MALNSQSLKQYQEQVQENIRLYLRLRDQISTDLENIIQ